MTTQDDDAEIWLAEDADGEWVPRSKAPVWQGALLGVVAMLYLVTAAAGVVTVAGHLLGWASDSFWSWVGATASSGREELRDDVIALTRRGACLAGIGVVLGLWWKRRPVLAVSAVGVVVALAVGLLTYGIAAPNGPPRPEDDGPRACVEHSGGSTDCPGG